MALPGFMGDFGLRGSWQEKLLSGGTALGHGSMQGGVPLGRDHFTYSHIEWVGGTAGTPRQALRLLNLEETLSPPAHFPAKQTNQTLWLARHGEVDMGGSRGRCPTSPGTLRTSNQSGGQGHASDLCFVGLCLILHF